MTLRVSPGQAPPLFLGWATLLFTSWTAVPGRGGGRVRGGGGHARSDSASRALR